MGEGQEATLLLLVSELVSNSIRHAGLRSDERIRLRRPQRERARLRRGLRRGPLRPRPVKREQHDALEPGGLGLVLVDEMADRWGVHCHADETCVWFELACEAYEWRAAHRDRRPAINRRAVAGLAHPA